MSVSKIAGLLLSSAAMVAGHGYVSGAVVDGTYYKGFIVDTYNYMDTVPDNIGWAEDATDLGYVDGSSYASSDIICHKDATPGAISAEITAGGSVELQWTTWPESHHGPVITYLANCNGDCSTVDKTTLEFFKIDEGGLIDDSTLPGTWATDELIAANNSRTVTIPSTIAAGNYVLRHEIIALHSAGETNGAQNYPQCINLKVTGGGSDNPTGVLGTALYTATDPGILVNIYTTLDSYEIPGPALYSGASSGSSTTAAASSTTAAAATTTAAAVTTSSAEVAVTTVPTASASTVSASPIPSSSSFAHPHFTRTRTVRPHHSPSGTPPPSYAPTTVVSDSAPAETESVYSDVTVTEIETATAAQSAPAQFTGEPATAASSAPAQFTDEPTQTASAPADSVTVTASAGDQSAAQTSASDDSSEASATATATATAAATASASSSDYSTYLSSLSAEKLLTLIRSTLKWLVSDNKVHARALSS